MAVNGASVPCWGVPMRHAHFHSYVPGTRIEPNDTLLIANSLSSMYSSAVAAVVTVLLGCWLSTACRLANLRHHKEVRECTGDIVKSDVASQAPLCAWIRWAGRDGPPADAT